MKLATLTDAQLRTTETTERTLSIGTWIITFGAVLFSVLTVTPLVREVTPDGWEWTAPILPIVVDAAVVIVIRLDATVSRLGADPGRWPVVLRWLTGVMTLALNVGGSALKSDWVGVAVHAVAPLLLIVTAEASLGYRRAISRALDEQEAARREQADADRREQQEREGRERREREDRERREREDREREQEREDRRVREGREHEARLAEQERTAEAERARQHAEMETAQLRDQREHERAVADAERHERREREDQEKREQEKREQEKREQEKREQEKREQEKREQEKREQEKRESRPVSTTKKAPVSAAHTAKKAPVRATVSTKKKTPVSTKKVSEGEALTAIEQGLRSGMSTREIADQTGWSSGWVAARAKEIREQLVAA